MAMHPKRLALTGGIGCGKTTVANRLIKYGFKTIDTDQIAREVVQPGREGYKKVIDAFGNNILNEDRTIHRGQLGHIVFSDPSRRYQLNSLLHPIIRKQWQMRQHEFWREFPEVPVVIVIPLLFETGLENEFDSIACVACSESTQQKRLLARGLSSEQMEQRLEAQMPVKQKMALAELVLWNDGELSWLDRMARQLETRWRSMRPV